MSVICDCIMCQSIARISCWSGHWHTLILLVNFLILIVGGFLLLDNKADSWSFRCQICGAHEKGGVVILVLQHQTRLGKNAWDVEHHIVVIDIERTRVKGIIDPDKELGLESIPGLLLGEFHQCR